MDGTVMRYWIDGNDCLARVDDAWREFALANDAPELAADSALGKPIASFCTDATTTEIWVKLLARARSGAAVDVRIRCDAPDYRRLFDLRLAGETSQAVAITTELVSEERRSHVALLEAYRPADVSLLRCCSWCKKWLAPAGRWVEVEELVSTLGLLERPLLPQVSHGICAACGRRLRGGRA
jgi:hypothetical protein